MTSKNILGKTESKQQNMSQDSRQVILKAENGKLLVTLLHSQFPTFNFLSFKILMLESVILVFWGGFFYYLKYKHA